MKTVILEYTRMKPSVTERRFARMKGTGTAYITDSLKEKYHKGMIEIGDDDIEKFVSEGKDILYRVSTYGGGHRVFRSV